MQGARRGSLTVAAALAIALAFPSAALAGVVILSESEQPASAAKAGGDAAGDAKAAKKEGLRLTGRMYAEGKDLRLQGTRTDAEGKAAGTVLFRGATDTVVVINDDERTYFEITRADAKRLASALDSARAQIRAQLETMSPEDRKAVEEAMGAFGGMGSTGEKKPPEPTKAVATGKTRDVGGRTCRMFDVQKGGKRIGEACVATWKDVGLEPKDLDALRDLAKFQRDVMAQVEWEGMETAPGAEVFELMDEIGGVPIWIRTMHEGKPIVLRVTDVQRKDVDPKLFQVPAGYSRTSIPG